MRLMKRFTLALTVASALALPAAAQQRELPRQPPGHPMQGMMEGGGMTGMMEGGGMMGMMGGGGDAAGRERPQLTLALQNRVQLGLTDVQAKTLESLAARFRAAAERRMRELEAAEAELAALLKQDASAGPLVEARVRAIEKLRADLRLERIRTIAEGRAALDAEQRARLDQLAAASGRGMMGMRGGMEGMDHGGRRGSTGPERGR